MMRRIVSVPGTTETMPFLLIFKVTQTIMSVILTCIALFLTIIARFGEYFKWCDYFRPYVPIVLLTHGEFTAHGRNASSSHAVHQRTLIPETVKKADVTFDPPAGDDWNDQEVGQYVAVSENYAVIGALGWGSYGGKAYLYDLQGKHVRTYSNDDISFGESMAIDGDSLVVCCPFCPIENSVDSGKCFLYSISNGSDQPQQVFNYGRGYLSKIALKDGVLAVMAFNRIVVYNANDANQWRLLDDQYDTFALGPNHTLAVAVMGDSDSSIRVYDVSDPTKVVALDTPSISVPNDVHGLAVDDELILASYILDSNSMLLVLDASDGTLLANLGKPPDAATSLMQQVELGFSKIFVSNPSSQEVYVYDRATFELKYILKNPESRGQGHSELFALSISSATGKDVLLVGSKFWRQEEDMIVNEGGRGYLYSMSLSLPACNRHSIEQCTSLVEAACSSMIGSKKGRMEGESCVTSSIRDLCYNTNNNSDAAHYANKVIKSYGQKALKACAEQIRRRCKCGDKYCVKNTVNKTCKYPTKNKEQFVEKSGRKFKEKCGQ